MQQAQIIEIEVHLRSLPPKYCVWPFENTSDQEHQENLDVIPTHHYYFLTCFADWNGFRIRSDSEHFADWILCGLL